MKHNFLKILKSKAFYIVAALLVQVGILLMLMGYFSSRFLPVYYFMILLSLMMCFHIINRDSDSSSKLLWVLIIMALPIFGGMIYLLFGGRKIPKALMVKDRQAYSDYKKYALQNKEALDTNPDDFVLNKMVSMAWNNGYFPVYDNVQTDYYETGQDQFASILEDLKKAEHFIFIETFILNSGIMWDSILEILIDKAAQGVDVRLIYDDFGSFTKLDDTYPDWLATKGIKTYSFNPMIPQLAMQMNNRDHRKIIVVDGKIAYTGGINIADEYINQKERFGYWKDMGVRIQGKAVEMFTISFLQIWNYQASENIPYDLFTLDALEFNQIKGEGYCIPFSDSPTDDSNTGKNMHLNQLMLASRYCWLTTPYLILDQEMMDTLILAANNGVDVRIVVPAIPDKKMVYQVTKANFEPLLKKGVKIYVYTPGFIHGKVCLSDDRNALVGTVNMDFRSYYLNYECGVWFHDTSNLPQIKQDFEQIFQDSHEVTLEEVKNEKLVVRLYRQFLRIFSPLM